MSESSHESGHGSDGYEEYYDSNNATRNTYFKVSMGRWKQVSLWQCGFKPLGETQMQRIDHEAMAAQHAAWGVLLQQPVIQDAQTVAALLSTSCGLRSAVLLYMQQSHQLHLSAPKLGWDDPAAPATGPQSSTGASQQPAAQAALKPPTNVKLDALLRFLCRHGAMLRLLDLTGLAIDRENHFGQWGWEATARLACALWEAGPRVGLVELTVPLSRLLVCQQCAAMPRCCRGLTRLTLLDDTSITCSRDCYMHCSEHPGLLQRLSSTLSSLSGLRFLSITAPPKNITSNTNVNPLLPALSGLTNITYLSANLTRHADLGRYLPVSLRELHIGGQHCEDWDEELVVDSVSESEDWPPDPDAPYGVFADLVDFFREPFGIRTYPEGLGTWRPPYFVSGRRPVLLDLARLTALTALKLTSLAHHEHIYVGDVLPPNVQRLHASHVYGCALHEVVLPLAHLTHLDLAWDGCTGEELLKVTSMVSLKEMSLHQSYHSSYAVDCVCATWPLLPLTSLAVDSPLSGTTLEQLALLTGLTCLRLHIKDGTGARLPELTAALTPLLQLRCLQLIVACREHSSEPLHAEWRCDCAWHDCITAMCRMTQLTSLELAGHFTGKAGVLRLKQLKMLKVLRVSKSKGCNQIYRMCRCARVPSTTDLLL